jgi:hypothetical protein
LVDANDRDIATTPGVNRTTSTVTPFTVVSPPGDAQLQPSSRGSTARFVLLGAAAAVVLFGAAFASGMFKTVNTSASNAAATLPRVPGHAEEPTAGAVPAAAVPPSGSQATPPAPGQPTVVQAGATGSNAAAPVILDFDSLPVEGSRGSARANGDNAAAPSITLEAARKAMLEPAAEAPSTAETPPPSSLDGPVKSAPPSAAPAAATDPAKPPGEFDNGAARAALAAASQRAQGCLGMGLVHAAGKVVVVFEPSGGVSAVNILSPEFAKPPLGPCLVTAFKQANVPPFVGAATAVSKTFTQ